MLKRLLLLAGLLSFVSPAFAAGTITMSLTQRFDNSTHLPLSGGLMYFIQAGTTSTPQNAYQDSALTLPYANPLTLDSGGNIPQLFFADGVIKVRITNSAGNQQIVQDNIQVTGASSGGGGGGTVDPTTIIATGDFKLVYNTGVLTGFVRCNGRTIGSATSGASERANADTSALFAFLWNADPNLAVSGGRGASAAADYAANKTLTLPDCRGRGIAGLDDMGNSPAGRLTTTYFGSVTGFAGTTLGGTGGSESTTLTVAQLPTGITSSNASQSITVNTTNNGASLAGNNNGAGLFTLNGGGAASGALPAVPLGGSWLTVSSISGANSISVTSNNTSGAAHRTVQPTILLTTYIKL